MNVPRTIIEDTLVPHTAFEKAVKAVDQCYRYAQDAVEPICLALVGESRTGKTRVLSESVSKHPAVRSTEGLTSPILAIKTPSEPTAKGLASSLLDALKDPACDKGTEKSMTTRALKLLKNSSTRMIMIDEFQHFYDRGKHQVMHHVADWLKILADDAKVALVVAGLPSCMAVLEQNEQLAGRFLAPVWMPRFDWNSDDLRAEYKAILSAFDESIRRYFDLPSLDSDEMAFRTYCGTGGLFGYLTKFLRQTVWNAIDERRRVITLSDLAAAHRQSVWNTNALPGIPAPFSARFDPSPTPALIARVKAIGLRVEDESEPTRPSPKNQNKVTAAQALRAS